MLGIVYISIAVYFSTTQVEKIFLPRADMPSILLEWACLSRMCSFRYIVLVMRLASSFMHFWYLQTTRTHQ